MIRRHLRVGPEGTFEVKIEYAFSIGVKINQTGRRMKEASRMAGLCHLLLRVGAL